MNTHADKTHEHKDQLVTNESSQGNSESDATFVDNRLKAVEQRKFQEMANDSPRAIQLKVFQEMANNGGQAKKAAQFQTMVNTAIRPQPIQKKENKTGLPNNLKTGIEKLSGYSMDDVKVHRNSDKPAQLQAHAYAQGTEIHLGPGQEKHLAHETWHVVQQKQGRVTPTTQMKGIQVNDDSVLEKEADQMGEKAEKMVASETRSYSGSGEDPREKGTDLSKTIQRAKITGAFKGLGKSTSDSQWKSGGSDKISGEKSEIASSFYGLPGIMKKLNGSKGKPIFIVDEEKLTWHHIVPKSTLDPSEGRHIGAVRIGPNPNQREAHTDPGNRFTDPNFTPSGAMSPRSRRIEKVFGEMSASKKTASTAYDDITDIIQDTGTSGRLESFGMAEQWYIPIAYLKKHSCWDKELEAKPVYQVRYRIYPAESALLNDVHTDNIVPAIRWTDLRQGQIDDTLWEKINTQLYQSDSHAFIRGEILQSDFAEASLKSQEESRSKATSEMLAMINKDPAIARIISENGAHLINQRVLQSIGRKLDKAFQELKKLTADGKAFLPKGLQIDSRLYAISEWKLALYPHRKINVPDSSAFDAINVALKKHGSSSLVDKIDLLKLRVSGEVPADERERILEAEIKTLYISWKLDDEEAEKYVLKSIVSDKHSKTDMKKVGTYDQDTIEKRLTSSKGGRGKRRKRGGGTDKKALKSIKTAIESSIQEKGSSRAELEEFLRESGKFRADRTSQEWQEAAEEQYTKWQYETIVAVQKLNKVIHELAQAKIIRGDITPPQKEGWRSSDFIFEYLNDIQQEIQDEDRKLEGKHLKINLSESLNKKIQAQTSSPKSTGLETETRKELSLELAALQKQYLKTRQKTQQALLERIAKHLSEAFDDFEEISVSSSTKGSLTDGEGVYVPIRDDGDWAQAATQTSTKRSGFGSGLQRGVAIAGKNPPVRRALAQKTKGGGNCAFNGFSLVLAGLLREGRLPLPAIVQLRNLLPGQNLAGLMQLAEQAFGHNQNAQAADAIQNLLQNRLRRLSVRILFQSPDALDTVRSGWMTLLQNAVFQNLGFAMNADIQVDLFDANQDILQDLLTQTIDSAGRFLDHWQYEIAYTAADIRQWWDTQEVRLMQHFNQTVSGLYLHEMEQDTVWAGGPELNALARFFGIHLMTVTNQYPSLDDEILAPQAATVAVNGNVTIVGVTFTLAEIFILRNHDLIAGRPITNADPRFIFRLHTRTEVQNTPGVGGGLLGRFLQVYDALYPYQNGREPVIAGMYNPHAAHWEALRSSAPGNPFALVPGVNQPLSNALAASSLRTPRVSGYTISPGIFNLLKQSFHLARPEYTEERALVSSSSNRSTSEQRIAGIYGKMVSLLKLTTRRGLKFLPTDTLNECLRKMEYKLLAADDSQEIQQALDDILVLRKFFSTGLGYLTFKDLTSMM